MAYIPCIVGEGMREDFCSAKVTDIDRKNYFVGVTKDFIKGTNEKRLLPIGIVRQDRDQKRILVELPIEADSGIARLWVPFDDVVF